MRRILWALLGVLLLARGAEAATYYVDCDDTFNGTGLVDSAAASNGAAGRFNALQSAFTALAANDTLIVHACNGTEGYVTTFGTGSDAAIGSDSGFHLEASGTGSSWITIKNAPGESPVIRNCAEAATTQTACDRPTITANGRSRIKFTDDNANYADGHLIVYGEFYLVGCDYPPTNISQVGGPMEVSYTQIERGYDEAGSGNWTGIWSICHDYDTGAGREGGFHHNVITIYPIGSGGGAQSSASGISLYNTLDLTIENNTVDMGNNFSESQGGCYDLKHFNSDVTVRYNLCKNSSMFSRAGNSNYADITGWPTSFRNLVYTGNLAYRGTFSSDMRKGIRLAEGSGPGFGGGFCTVTINNNTFSGYDAGIEARPQTGTLGECDLKDISIYNNIWDDIGTHAAVDTPRSLHWEHATNVTSGGGLVPLLYDYNCADTDTPTPRYRIGATSYTDLAALISGTAYGDHEVAVASMTFTNAAAGDYSLQAGSACHNAGKTGGTSGGSTIDMGYTGVTSCVGAACGEAAPATIYYRFRFK